MRNLESDKKFACFSPATTDFSFSLSLKVVQSLLTLVTLVEVDEALQRLFHIGSHAFSSIRESLEIAQE